MANNRSMTKKTKQTIQLLEGVDPGLFGQKYSSRDYPILEMS